MGVLEEFPLFLDLLGSEGLVFTELACELVLFAVDFVDDHDFPAEFDDFILELLDGSAEF